MIKICHIISDTNIGGAGILLLNLLSGLDRRRFSVSVILPRESLLKKRLLSLSGVTVYEAKIAEADKLLAQLKEKAESVLSAPLEKENEEE